MTPPSAIIERWRCLSPWESCWPPPGGAGVVVPGAVGAEVGAMGVGSRLFDMRCELPNIRGRGLQRQECPVRAQNADPVMTLLVRPVALGSGK